MKYSIIIPTTNNLPFLQQAINAVFRNTTDYELIIIDNGSADDTEAYLSALAKKHPCMHIIRNFENMGFAPACNRGMQYATGEFIVLLNDDTVVTPTWLDHMIMAMPACEAEYDARPVGIVGPVSNNVGGEQRVTADPYDPNLIDGAAVQRYKEFNGHTRLAGFISGFCMLISRACYDDTGLLDERFKVGGVEDTEYCARAQRKGYKLAIDDGTFVHHYGQQSLLKLGDDYAPIHKGNQLVFMEKYYNPDPQKLIATFRVRDQPEYLQAATLRASLFVDGIIIVCDRCDQETLKVAHEAPKLLEVLETNKEWDLYRDRCLQMEAAKTHKADWIIALDADEILEDSFTYEVAHNLMAPLNPNTNAYSFPFCTFFLGESHYREDGIFGRMRGLRMYRNMPNQAPRMVRNNRRSCLHCPSIATHNVVDLRYRVKHYGYKTQEICNRKYSFYTDLDPNPDRGYIGPRGYAHLIDPALSLNRFVEKNTLALCMVVKNEDINLFTFLYRFHAYFDEIVIVDTGSSDCTKQVAKLFGAKVWPHKWKDSFAEARNYAKSKCESTWLFTPDPDEELDTHSFIHIFKMMETANHAYLFKIVNLQPNGEAFFSDNCRLMRNIPEIYWTNRVHENITDSVKANNLSVEVAPFQIKHVGYLKDPDVKERKAKQYNRLLKKDLKEHPEKALTHFHKSFQFYSEGKEFQADAELKKALSLDPQLFIASKELGLRHLDNAIKFFQQAAQVIPDNHYFSDWTHQTLAKLQATINTPVG